jgi:hypothetical protein
MPTTLIASLRAVPQLCPQVMRRTSLTPGRYLVRCWSATFEGIDSECGIGWRATDWVGGAPF